MVDELDWRAQLDHSRTVNKRDGAFTWFSTYGCDFNDDYSHLVQPLRRREHGYNYGTLFRPAFAAANTLRDSG